MHAARREDVARGRGGLPLGLLRGEEPRAADIAPDAVGVKAHEHGIRVDSPLRAAERL
ncbi:hypothetical protein [Streptomyces sp. NPDC001100]